ncbi:MAG: hypothetical protein IPI48_17150 [bacterium]|jgi:hypothetical protein|nr:hypothetical protein [bacterium]
MHRLVNAPLRSLLLSAAALTILAVPAQATIMGPGQITATTAVPSQGGFTIDQICDGLLTAPGWYNGFAVNPGIIGTIHLELATAQALGDFVLWNDVNVSAEGIANFRLDFFDAANLPLGSTPVLVGPIGQTAPAIYPFPVVENVKRVDLVVLSLNPSPRLEIREVAFNWSDVVATEGSSWSRVKALFR